jgi:hypothetical protein
MGSFFFDVIVTGAPYLNVLQGTIVPVFLQLYGNGDKLYQQEETLTHYYHDIKAYHDNIISTGG